MSESRSATPEKLRRNRLSYAVTLQAAIREHSRNPLAVFCFFEGKDSSYYAPRINYHMILRGGLASIWYGNCEGKKNVLDIHQAIKNNTSLSSMWAMYFVDRDFEENNMIDVNCYVTYGYAVENCYTTPSTVEGFIRWKFFNDQVYSVDEVATVSDIIASYEKSKESFRAAIGNFNTWACAQKVIRGDRSHRLNVFDDQRLVELRFETCEVIQLYTYENLDNAAGVPCTTVAELRAGLNWFDGKDPNWCHRGKQELQFLGLFLRSLLQRAQNGQPPFNVRRAVHFGLSARNLMIELSPFAYTPPCLIRYLDEFTRAYFSNIGSE